MAFCACGFVASASARECAKLEEEEKTEEEEEKEEQLPVPQVSLTTLKSSLTLRQMIQLGWSMCISEMCVRGGWGRGICYSLSFVQCETPQLSYLPCMMC